LAHLTHTPPRENRASGNTQRFSNLPTNVKVDGLEGVIDLEERRNQGVWQLVPWVYSIADEPDLASEYDYRENGYWHICKALQMFSSDPRFKFDRCAPLLLDTPPRHRRVT
jgi:hypothetical protein